MRTSGFLFLTLTFLALCPPRAFPQHSSMDGAARPHSPVQPVPKFSNEEHGFIDAGDGIRLAYRKFGRGLGVVIVPGGFLTNHAFDRLGLRHTVIAYDMRNRGQSSPVSDPRRLTIKDDVRDLETVRRHFGVRRFTPIGYSYLGLMVLLYAMDYPDRVERIVQVGPVPRKFGTQYPSRLVNQDSVVDEHAWNKLQQLRAQEYDRKHPKDFCEMHWKTLRVRLVGDPNHVDRLGPSPCDMPNEWPVNLERHLSAHLESLKTLVVTPEKLAAVSVPVLVIHGTKDRNVPYGAGREWALTLPNARLLPVEGAAHNVWADAPEVADWINRFLAGRWPQSAQKVTNL